MEGFLTFIFFTILTIWLLGMIGRIVLRRWIAKKQREFAERFGQGMGGSTYKQYTWGRNPGSDQGRNEREGDVKVQRTERLEKKVNREVGDYVEFEEIEETEQ